MIKHILTKQDTLQSNSTHLLNFSGGFDSTYYLYRILRDTKHKILLHHCVFSKRREPAESEACKNIIAYFTNYHNRLEYVITHYTREGIKGYLYDLLPLHCVTGLLLINGYPNLKYIYKPTCLTDLKNDIQLRTWLENGKSYNEYYGVDEKSSQSRRIVIKHLVSLLTNRKFEWLMPYWDKTKSEMIKEMPTELVKIVHFCRQPRGKQPCERCHACRNSREGRKFHNLI